MKRIFRIISISMWAEPNGWPPTSPGSRRKASVAISTSVQAGYERIYSLYIKRNKP